MSRKGTTNNFSVQVPPYHSKQSFAIKISLDNEIDGAAE